jgi:hypothetical protein
MATSCGRPAASCIAVASTTATRPWRPSAAASERAKAAASTPSLTGSSPIVAGAAYAFGRCSVRRRSMAWRVSARDTLGLPAIRRSNAALSSRTSTESRIATTVAERGSSVNSAISPMIWPRAISRTMRCVPSSSRT